jgi:hypothetical protein
MLDSDELGVISSNITDWPDLKTIVLGGTFKLEFLGWDFDDFDDF